MLTTIVKRELTVSEMADAVVAAGEWRGCNFKNLKTRNAVARKLSRRVIATRKSSSGLQRIHPQYVLDFVGECEIGFGNTDYLNYFRIYGLNVVS